MFTRTIMIVLALSLAGGAPAQNRGRSRSEDVVAAIESHFRAWERERLEAERLLDRRFLKNARSFVTKWNEFVAEYDRGVFNARTAQEVSRAFRKLERSGSWPGPGSDARPKRKTALPGPPLPESQPDTGQ